MQSCGWVVVVALAACGRIDFARTGPGITDATDATDAVVAPACTAVGLTDDFDDGVASPLWDPYTDVPVTTAETGGHLVITLVPNATGVHYGGYASHATYDLRDHCMFATLVSTPPLSGPVEMQVSVRTGTHYAGFTTDAGNLVLFTQFNGTNTTVGTIAFDASLHRILRVRESGGTTFWDTSPDGIVFTVQASEPTPFDFSAIILLLNAGTYGSVATPGAAVYDNFDLP